MPFQLGTNKKLTINSDLGIPDGKGDYWAASWVKYAHSTTTGGTLFSRGRTSSANNREFYETYLQGTNFPAGSEGYAQAHYRDASNNNTTAVSTTKLLDDDYSLVISRTTDGIVGIIVDDAAEVTADNSSDGHITGSGPRFVWGVDADPNQSNWLTAQVDYLCIFAGTGPTATDIAELNAMKAPWQLTDSVPLSCLTMLANGTIVDYGSLGLGAVNTGVTYVAGGVTLDLNETRAMSGGASATSTIGNLKRRYTRSISASAAASSTITPSEAAPVRAISASAIVTTAINRGIQHYLRTLEAQATANSSITIPTDPVRDFTPTGILFDWPTFDKQCQFSDNWASCWAKAFVDGGPIGSVGPDGSIYLSWGDGAGTYNHNTNGRVSLGVGRIDSNQAAFVGGGTPSFPDSSNVVNVWGDAPTYAENDNGGKLGKCYGIMARGSNLYDFITDGGTEGSGTDGYIQARLRKSTDGGATWTEANWVVEGTGSDSPGTNVGTDFRCITPTFVDFGYDQEGIKDGYVKIAWIGVDPTFTTPLSTSSIFNNSQGSGKGRIYLSRMPLSALENLQDGQMQWFTGYDVDGNETYGNAADFHSRTAPRTAIHEDADGVGWTVSLSQVKKLGNLYILCTEHTDSLSGKLGVWTSKKLCGPYTLLKKFGKGAEPAIGDGTIDAKAFFLNVNQKFTAQQPDKNKVVFGISGIGTLDALGTVNADFSGVDNYSRAMSGGASSSSSISNTVQRHVRALSAAASASASIAGTQRHLRTVNASASSSASISGVLKTHVRSLSGSAGVSSSISIATSERALNASAVASSTISGMSKRYTRAINGSAVASTSVSVGSVGLLRSLNVSASAVSAISNLLQRHTRSLSAGGTVSVTIVPTPTNPLTVAQTAMQARAIAANRYSLQFGGEQVVYRSAANGDKTILAEVQRQGYSGTPHDSSGQLFTPDALIFILPADLDGIATIDRKNDRVRVSMREGDPPVIAKIRSVSSPVGWWRLELVQ